MACGGVAPRVRATVDRFEALVRGVYEIPRWQKGLAVAVVVVTAYVLGLRHAWKNDDERTVEVLIAVPNWILVVLLGWFTLFQEHGADDAKPQREAPTTTPVPETVESPADKRQREHEAKNAKMLKAWREQQERDEWIEAQRDGLGRLPLWLEAERSPRASEYGVHRPKPIVFPEDRPPAPKPTPTVYVPPKPIETPPVVEAKVCDEHAHQHARRDLQRTLGIDETPLSCAENCPWEKKKELEYPNVAPVAGGKRPLPPNFGDDGKEERPPKSPRTVGPSPSSFGVPPGWKPGSGDGTNGTGGDHKSSGGKQGKPDGGVPGSDDSKTGGISQPGDGKTGGEGPKPSQSIGGTSEQDQPMPDDDTTGDEGARPSQSTGDAPQQDEPMPDDGTTGDEGPKPSQSTGGTSEQEKPKPDDATTGSAGSSAFPRQPKGLTTSYHFDYQQLWIASGRAPITPFGNYPGVSAGKDENVDMGAAQSTALPQMPNDGGSQKPKWNFESEPKPSTSGNGAAQGSASFGASSTTNGATSGLNAKPAPSFGPQTHPAPTGPPGNRPNPFLVAPVKSKKWTAQLLNYGEPASHNREKSASQNRNVIRGDLGHFLALFANIDPKAPWLSTTPPMDQEAFNHECHQLWFALTQITTWVYSKDIKVNHKNIKVWDSDKIGPCRPSTVNECYMGVQPNIWDLRVKLRAVYDANTSLEGLKKAIDELDLLHDWYMNEVAKHKASSSASSTTLGGPPKPNGPGNGGVAPEKPNPFASMLPGNLTGAHPANAAGNSAQGSGAGTSSSKAGAQRSIDPFAASHAPDKTAVHPANAAGTSQGANRPSDNASASSQLGSSKFGSKGQAGSSNVGGGAHSSQNTFGSSGTAPGGRAAGGNGGSQGQQQPSAGKKPTPAAPSGSTGQQPVANPLLSLNDVKEERKVVGQWTSRIGESFLPCKTSVKKMSSVDRGKEVRQTIKRLAWICEWCTPDCQWDMNRIGSRGQAQTFLGRGERLAAIWDYMDGIDVEASLKESCQSALDDLRDLLKARDWLK